MSETDKRGSTRDALAITAFRRLYIGSFLSGLLVNTEIPHLD